jgi:hypothetical protein
MLSHTRRALEDFDNQHDFERLAADVLNALGYSHVEPMAPRGGSDGGRDIKFREGDTPGVVLVTLDQKIRDKFKRDLLKLEDTEGVIALFCNVDVTTSQKLDFAKDAIQKGYRLEVFDLERLRSLFDTSLKEVRRRYLGIDDEVAARLRSEITRLLRFPVAVADRSQAPTVVEGLLSNKVPRQLFDVLMTYEEQDVREVPGMGHVLLNYLHGYYGFRQKALAIEKHLLLRIERMVAVRFAAGWRMHLKYAIMRFAGASQEAVTRGGDFLNYDITWEDVERVFKQLHDDPVVSSEMHSLFQIYARLCEDLGKFAPENTARQGNAA